MRLRNLLNAPAVTLILLAAMVAAPSPGQREHPVPFLARAQFPANTELEAGVMLVADRELQDPNFAETVILIVRYDDEGTMGLVLSRRTKVPVSKVLDDWTVAKGRTDAVFLGGPVERTSILALVRSKARLEKAVQVLPEVHFIAERPQLQASLGAETKPDRLRIYVGYAGWAPEQLEDEIEAGAWRVIPGDANLVFDGDPDSLWRRLIKKTETQIARAASAGYSVAQSIAERE